MNEEIDVIIDEIRNKEPCDPGCPKDDCLACHEEWIIDKLHGLKNKWIPIKPGCNVSEDAFFEVTIQDGDHKFVEVGWYSKEHDRWYYHNGDSLSCRFLVYRPLPKPFGV